MKGNWWMNIQFNPERIINNEGRSRTARDIESIDENEVRRQKKILPPPGWLNSIENLGGLINWDDAAEVDSKREREKVIERGQRT